MSEARKGKEPWNKGKTGLQVSHMKGKHHDDETKRKIAEARKGQEPWNKGKKLVDQASPQEAESPELTEAE